MPSIRSNHHHVFLVYRVVLEKFLVVQCGVGLPFDQLPRISAGHGQVLAMLTQSSGTVHGTRSQTFSNVFFNDLQVVFLAPEFP